MRYCPANADFPGPPGLARNPLNWELAAVPERNPVAPPPNLGGAPPAGAGPPPAVVGPQGGDRPVRAAAAGRAAPRRALCLPGLRRGGGATRRAPARVAAPGFLRVPDRADGGGAAGGVRGAWRVAVAGAAGGAGAAARAGVRSLGRQPGAQPRPRPAPGANGRAEPEQA